MNLRSMVLAVTLLGLAAGCDGDRVCGLNWSAAGGSSCSMDSGECFTHTYSMDCERGTTGGDYECECFYDGVSAATCSMVDICDSGGVFFESDGDDHVVRMYTRMETCCGFDIPY